MSILIVLVLNLFYITKTTSTNAFSTSVTLDPYHHLTLNISLPLIPLNQIIKFNLSYMDDILNTNSSLTNIYTDVLVYARENKAYEIWNYELTTQSVYI
jgi:hypothetical protein